MTSLELVLDALDAANVDRLRLTLEKICKQSDAALHLVCNELLVRESDLEKHNKEINNAYFGGSKEKGSKNSVNGTSLKRKREEHVGVRYATCMQCEQEFDATENGEESCEWHDGIVMVSSRQQWFSSADLLLGELEIDYEHDTWDDWDEPCHGIMNTDENREGYPEGFIWSCCERRGGEDACRVGKHVAEDIPKRARSPIPSAQSPPRVRRCLPSSSNSWMMTCLGPSTESH